MQIGVRFPGADIERRKFLGYLDDCRKQGDVGAGPLKTDMVSLTGGKTVAKMDTEVRYYTAEAEHKAWLWGGLGVGASLLGAAAGAWWGGRLLGAAGLLAGLPLIKPVLSSRQEAAHDQHAGHELRRYALQMAQQFPITTLVSPDR